MYIIIRALFGNVAIQGWASLIVSIYFIGGMIMVVLGIIGIYVGKMYNETKQRPLYVVAERVGFERRPTLASYASRRAPSPSSEMTA
jgi:dolichol-phosphate mannosyltransferase